MSKIYVNITAEGALLNPQNIESEDQAYVSFLQFRGNNTVSQTKVIGIERVKYYLNQEGRQEFKEEWAAVVEFGPVFGYVPLPFSGESDREALTSLIDHRIAVVPLTMNPNAGQMLLIFDRVRALEIMQSANLDKLKPEIEWTGVVTGVSRKGYLMDLSGFRAWLPNGLVEHGVHQPMSLKRGDMFPVKVLRRTEKNRLVVSRRDAIPHPFDRYKDRYHKNGQYLAEIKTLGLYGVYAVLGDSGVSVQLRRGEERGVLDVGTKVLIRLTGKVEAEKLFEGKIEEVI